MASAEQQLVQLMQQMATMQDRVQTLEGQNHQLGQQLQDAMNRLGGQSAGAGPREARGGLFDKKLFEPSVLEDAEVRG